MMNGSPSRSLPSLISAIVNRDDVAVLELAGRTGFLEKAFGYPFFAGAEQLDGDLTTNARIAAQENHTHAAASNNLDDLITANGGRQILREHVAPYRSIAGFGLDYL